MGASRQRSAALAPRRQIATQRTVMLALSPHQTMAAACNSLRLGRLLWCGEWQSTPVPVYAGLRGMSPLICGSPLKQNPK